MGVDKFGRHSVKTESIKGPKGDGFNFTAEGDYDCEGKRLCNSGDPVESGDSVNLKTLQETCLRIGTKRKAFDAKNISICNVGIPNDDTDVVTKGYLLEKIPKKLKDSYSTGQLRIQDLGYPLTPSDAVNVKYVSDTCLQLVNSNVFDARQTRITNVKDPVGLMDAVNRHYLSASTPGLAKNYWSFYNRRLAGVSDAIDETDAVNLRTLNTKITGVSNVLDSLKMRISKVETDIVENRKRAERQITKFGELLYPYLHKVTARTSTNYIDWDKVFEVYK